jgi:hypothetical protein
MRRALLSSCWGRLTTPPGPAASHPALPRAPPPPRRAQLWKSYAYTRNQRIQQLSPFEVDVLGPLFRDIGGKVKHKLEDNFLDVAPPLLFFIGLVAFVKEKRACAGGGGRAGAGAGCVRACAAGDGTVPLAAPSALGCAPFSPPFPLSPPTLTFLSRRQGDPDAPPRLERAPHAAAAAAGAPALLGGVGRV